LQRLADEYLTATGRRVQGRTAQVKYLLRDAISAFAGEDEVDAKLVKDLFFGDSQHKVTKSAGELLDTARRQSEFGSNEARFRQARHDDRLTHLAGHIMQDDPAVPGAEFGLDDAIPKAAAQRRVKMETGEIDTGELMPLTTGTYIHHDKEHLFFFVYSCRLPDGLEVWRQAEMSPVSVPQLLSIRKNQVLRHALSLCKDPPVRRQVRADPFEIVALNLILHDFADMAQKLKDAAAARTADFSAIAAELGRLEEQTRQTWPGYETDAELMGLSGLQFREFYAILLPFYASIGVRGAAEHLALLDEDETKRAAVARLSQLYRNERVMESIPIEL
jgi:hypothetical protein